VLETALVDDDLVDLTSGEHLAEPRHAARPDALIAVGLLEVGPKAPPPPMVCGSPYDQPLVWQRAQEAMNSAWPSEIPGLSFMCCAARSV
jgi:hypothetical protein